MLSIIPVALVAIPWAVGSFIATSKFVRFAATLTMMAYVSTRHYRSGEGPLSIKIPISIAPGTGVGGLLFQMSESQDELKKFQGKTFPLTKSEARSLAFLIDAALDNEKSIPALTDFLDNFPKARIA